MKTFQRLLTMLLAICLVVGMIPATAGAAENSDVSADSGDVNFGATNSVGHLLSENLQQEQEKAEEEATGGYNVLDLTIEGNTAKVEYASLEEATLVVALYTENGMQMLCSGKTTVDPEATEAIVTIEGEVPEYFLAAAYLLDTYDRSPLCGAYKTPLYTKEMQDLLASTADDYDEELVLNLDEDASTNFLVYEETTKIVESAGVTNNVVRCDDENGIYIIENADEQFTGLQVGDIVAYSYGEDGLLIAKVGEITIDGTTVTIIGDDSLTLEEVFSHVKIEDTATTEDVTVHENTGDDFVDFEGMSGGATYNARNARFTAPDSDFLKSGLKFTIKEKDFKGPGSDTKVTFSAEILVGLNPNIDFLATPTQQYIKFTADFSFGIDLSVTGEVNIPCIMLDCFSIPLAGGSVILDLNPMVMFGFSGEISFSFNYTCTIGFVWRRGDGIHKLDKQPKSDTMLDLEGRVYICFDPNPYLSIGGKIGGVRFNAPIGIEFIGKRSGTGSNVGDVVHACKPEDCISLELNGYMSLTGSISFFKKFKFSINFMELKAPLGKWYISENGSGKGDCPNVLYRVTITTRDMNGDRIGDISVKDVLTDEQVAVTSTNGVVAVYLPRGYRGFWAEIEGQKVATSYNVKEACSILLTSSREYLEKIEAQKKWMIHPDQITDHTKFASGTFSSGAQWIIYASGQMVVMGEGAMDNYNSVDKAPWYIYREMVTSVEIQPGVTSVSSNAFSGFPNLKKVIIANTVTSIGRFAFDGCKGLTSVKLPVDYAYTYKDGGSTYCYNAFYGCSNVTSIHYTYGQSGKMLDRNSSSVEHTLEYYCQENLETVYFDPGITQIGSYAFYESTKLKNINVPEYLTYVGSYAFNGCSALPSFELPEGLTYLGKRAFYGCSSLEKIVIPSTLEKIPDYCFASCPLPTELVIPDTVTSIGRFAFDGCKGLTSVKLPVDYAYTYKDGGSTYCYNAFYGCSNVTSIHYTYGQSGKMLDRDSNSVEHTLEYYCQENLETVYFDPGITQIGSYAFYESTKLKNINVPEYLTYVGSYAFNGCSALPSFELPEGLTYLGKRAFYGCSSLDKIVIPSTLEKIPDYCFARCPLPTELVIPDTVTSIGRFAFDGCKGLTSVKLPVDYAYTYKDGGSTYCYNAFYGCSNVTSIHYTYGQSGKMLDRNSSSVEHTLEYYCRENLETVYFDPGITQIGSYAFYESTKLKNINVPEYLTYVGSYAFNGCSALPSFELPEGLTYLGERAFYGCSSLEKIVIPSTLEKIPDYCFASCPLPTELVIPDTVTYLGSHAFSHCSGLTSVKLPVDYAYTYNDGGSTYYYNTFYGSSNVTSIHYTYGQSGKMPGRRSSDDHTLEYYCRENLETVYFDPGITQIGSYAFYESTKLKNINVPEYLTYVGSYAFYGCSALPSFELPEGLTYLGERAFYGCSSLDKIVIPSTLEKIPDYCFASCPLPTELVIPDTVTYLGSHAFSHCSGLTSVKLPVDYAYTYNDGGSTYCYNAFYGCSNVTSIHYTYGQSGKMLDRNSKSVQYTLEYYCRKNLETVYFDPGITHIGSYAFYDSSLSEAYFYGDAPTFGTNVFTSVTATAYYPAGNETWTDDVKQNYGGTLTWVPFEPEQVVSEETLPEESVTAYGVAVSASSSADQPVKQELEFNIDETRPTLDANFGGIYESEQVVSEETLPEESVTAYGVAASASSSADQPVKQELEFNIDETRPTLDANFGGIYESEIYEDYVLKRATFTDLVPGEQYVLLAMIDLDVEDPLSPENLLFVDQMAADENGTLVFEYVQRVTTNLSYVVACGASNKNLQDAVITFPEMQSDGNLQVVEPTVVYEGATLLEGIDYVIVGTASYTEAGTYTCTIRGIRNYTGVVTCEYTVASLGDVNCDGMVNGEDRLVLTRYLAKWIGYTEDMINFAAADVNCDGRVNAQDRLILTRHLAAWTGYETLGA